MPPIKPPASLFGRRLRTARLSLGLRQADLGRMLGMEEQNTGAPRISRYETGQHDPDPETAAELAQALGLPLAYFYATPDMLAEAILLIAKLPEDRQQEAIAALRAIAEKKG
ncbi:helix-turn-helix domain-containing protein [Xanthomonas euvesicatoria pv. euvesicatoria]|uniref:Helix-turn-helix transcriptional regulator n=5 Tax=Xanthomonas TaxID=338 RepID=A0A1L5R4T1_XANPE|nr:MULTISPECIES: helix-turn-helix transcriptional regulator [Xanthomonas]APO91524.1 transcriptional regulator [Xanthomonas euvesicatoria]APO99612.1 transcriptional regulator [Xanthomonas perforans]AQS76093.1 transcriptional regulator [Xanthomonas perforans 91-118]ARR16645.1 transcriptional regulator [Xanthomonas citri pv. citri]ARR22550.1 transcriptional regulator [Xanthomonas citri pv. citri]